MKKNDFIVASINNPDFTVADFKDVSEMNLGNTQMLSEEEYLKSKFIKENPLFQDSNGNFVKQKFSDFYRQKLRDFSEFSTESSLDNYQYGLFDTFRKAKDNVRPFGVSFERVANSERRSTGIVGPNMLGERTLSDRELAQREKVFDFEKGEFRDYTPNDLAFTKNPLSWIGSLFDDPLVLATYDENGTHYDPILGRQVEHVKGQKKLNDHGVPYYETLAGRSAANKDILSVTDTLTIDGSWINKYDFFDSDGMDKSIAGTVMKNLAVIAPIFIPGAGQYYAGALVVREMAKTMPMLYGMAGLFNNDLADSKLINTVSAFGNKFTGNTSDYAKDNMFSFENFGSLVSDVALQWSQQQWVINNLSKINKATKATEEAAKAKAFGEYTKQAKALMTQGEAGEIAMSRVAQLTGAKDRAALNELLKSDKWMATTYGGAALEKYLTPARNIIANKTKLAQDLSLGYMAIISNGDVYQDAIDHGASKREAAMLALGSTVGMFSVDKYLGLGEMFYDPAQKAERAAYRNAVLGETKKITEQLKQLTPEVTVGMGNKAVSDTKKGLGKYFIKGIQAGRKAVEDYHSAIKEGTLGFFGKAIGEGLEEVSEELVTDITKQLGEIAGQYGISGTTDLGAWNNMKDRYLMSFLGGAIGGGIFSLKDGNFKERQASGELLTLLRQGKGQEIRDELKRMYDKGQLGSTELSYKTEQTYDDKNNPQAVFLTADDKNQSQNDYAYNVLTQSIEQIESILQKNHLVKSEDELFENLVLQDENYTALKDYLQDASYITGYQRRYQQLVKNIVAQEQKIREMESSDSGANKNRTELDEAKRDLTNMLLERDKFFNGDYSLEYLQKMLFATNLQLAGGFMDLTKKQFTRSMLNVDYDMLDGGMKEFIDKAYEQQVKDPSKIEEQLDKSFDLFKKLQPQMEPILSKLTGGSKQWENIRKMLDEKGILKNEDMYTVDSMLPGEDEESESYVNRAILKEGESQADFAKRLRDRAMTVAEHNARLKIQKLQQVLDEAKVDSYDPATGMTKPASFIDPSTRRYLMAYLGETQQHIKNRLIARTIGTAVSKELLNDADNYDEMIKKVRDSLKERYERQLGQAYMTYLGTQDYKGLTSFYSQLTSKQKFTLEEVLKNLNREGWEDFTVAEQLAEMFTEATGAEGDFDFIQAAQQYDDLYKQYKAESDPDKQADLKEQLDALGQKEFEAWDQAKLDTDVQSMVDTEMKNLESKLSKLSNLFRTDTDLKAAKDLEERLSVEDNPAVELVKQMAPKIGSSAVEVEKALESIHKQFMDNEKPYDFVLSGDQEKYLQDAQKLIKIVTAMVAAASRPSNLSDGMTYNKAINKFHADHQGKQKDSDFFKNFEPLFEMDEKIGGQLIAALNGYSKEIDQWIKLSRTNRANSAASLQRASEALHDARLSFLSGSMISSKYLENSIIDASSNYALFDFERQFHENVNEAIKNGTSLKEVFEDLLAHLNQDDAILSGITSNIDEELKELTAYDKFMYLASLIALDPAEQLKKELQFTKDNPKVASLATQQPGMLLGQALDTNPDVINAALEVLQDLAHKKGINMPVLWNTTVVTGIGGGGKTTVEANYLSNDDELTWVSGPTDSQTEGLKTILPKARTISIEALKKSIYTGEVKSKTGKGLDKGWKPKLLDVDDSKFVTKDAPKHLVIDEATHIDNLDLQLISRWAKLAGVKLTLLGDENQRGKEYNLNREAIIAYRTPRLNFSLRNESIWKVQNQNQLVRMLDKMRNSSGETTEAVFKQVLEELHNKLNMSYFENETTLEGDKITSKVTAEDLSKLSGSIAYIGDNKTLEEFIKTHLNPGTTFAAMDKDSVQGKEFDYVIVDSDWGGRMAKGIDGKFKYEEHIFETTELLRDLYTMISRSRKGSIVIDNQISNVVNAVKEDYTTKYERLGEDVVQAFREARIAYIEDMLSHIKEEEPTTVEVTQEPETPGKEEEEPLEEPGIVNVPEKKKEEVQKVEKMDFEKKPIGYRAYGNVSFIGNVVINGKDWIPQSGPIRDIGLFSPKADGTLASTYEEKRQLVRDLNFVKSLFLYDLDIDLYDLPMSLRGKVTKDALKNAQFYLVAEDKNYVHNLTGRTTLKQDELDFIPGKVISIQARIDTPAGPAIITLGAVANPKTWIDGINNNPELSEEQKQEQIAQAQHYESQLKNLINSDSQEIHINKPKFNGRTELVPLRWKDVLTEEQLKNLQDPNVRRSVRIEDLYDDTSEFDARTGNSVVSPIHIITAPIPGIDVSLVGHAVLFVSNNNTLNPEQLGKLFIQQQNDRHAGRESKAQVRMIVLDNEGVSFHSLYRGSFKDIYSTTLQNKEFEFPMNLQATSIRMLASLWNFRADLNRFINAMNNSGYTREQLIDMAKTDSELYQELQNKKIEEYKAMYGKEPEQIPVISNTEYKQWLKNYYDKEKVDKVLKLIELNESSDLPRFRVGWSNITGSYIRRIYGLKEGNPYYKDVKNWKPEETNGIYINPDLAYQYQEMLNYLFDNVINKIYDTTPLDINERINYKEGEKWLLESKGMKLTINDEGKTINIPAQDKVKALPLILSKVANFLYYKAHFGQDVFNDKKVNKNLFHIYLDYENKKGEIEYDLDQFLSAEVNGETVKGLLKEASSKRDVIGQNEYKYKDDSIGYQDARIDNFFNLIFHGIPFEKHYNDFNHNVQSDTLALFKYGFLSDPVLIASGGRASDMIAPCATNRKLFKLDVVPGNPILEFTFDQVSEAVPEVEETTEHPLIAEARSHGLDTSRFNLDGYTDDEIVTFIERKFDQRDSKIFAKGEGDLSKLVMKVETDKIYTLADTNPEIGNIVKQEPTGDGKGFTITNDKGVKFEIRYSDHEITVSEPKATPGARVEGEGTKVEVKTEFTGDEIFNAVNVYIKDKPQYEDSDSLTEWLNGDTEVSYALQDLKAYKEDLRASLLDEGVLEKDDIDNIMNELDVLINKINTSDC